MSALTPASEVMLRHGDEFIERRVLFAGDLQDTCRPNSRPRTCASTLSNTITGSY